MIRTVVLGASPNPDRYSYKAVDFLDRYHYEVFPVGIRKGVINAHEILLGKPPIENVHTVTLYLNKHHQCDYYDYIFSLSPKRIIFNPGAENNELATLASEKGIVVMEACTLVLLCSYTYEKMD